MSFTQILADYGYLALFVGCLLEGETLLVMAGFAAHQGHLSFAAVVSIALVAGALGDQLFYWTGRTWGPGLLGRYPRLHERARTVSRLLQRYDAMLIVGVRFMYGLRIVGPVAIGASHVPPVRFALFNLLGAAIWAPLVAGAGYLFGHALKRLMGDVDRIEGVVFVLIAVIVGLYSLVKAHRRPRAEASEPDDPDRPG